MSNPRCRRPLIAACLMTLLNFSLGGTLCDYGSIPGRWVQGGRYNKQWQVFQRDCQLNDLAAEHVSAATQQDAGVAGKEPLGILLLGDSNERRLVTMTCNISGLETEEFNIMLDGSDGNAIENTCNSLEKRNCHSCPLPTLRLAKEAVWGFTDGPFHNDRIGSAEERVDKAFKLFQSQHGRQPDLVVIQSALWDLAAEWKRHEGNPPSSLTSADLSDEWLQAWQVGASKVLQQIKDSIAQDRTVLVWRTSAFPLVEECGSVNGWHKHARMGQHSHVAQLNAAARFVAGTQHGLQIVDVEAMTVGFNAPEEYLADTHHHRDYVDYSILNIYLNLIENARTVQGGHS